MRNDFPDPVDGLLRLGEPDKLEWLDYCALGIGPEHLTELVRVANDAALLRLEKETPKGWAPVHAIRAIGELQDPRSAKPLVSLLAGYRDDMRMMGETIKAIACVGAACVPACAEFLLNPEFPNQPRTGAAEALSIIGFHNADVRKDCVDALAAVLHQVDRTTPYVAGYAIRSLANLSAEEMLPLARQVYESGAPLDAHYESWDEVVRHFQHPAETDESMRVIVQGAEWPAMVHPARVRVTMREIEPPIWREFELPADSTLCRLHHVIQRAFGWRTYHLYEFHTPVGRYGDLALEANPDPLGELDVRDARISDFRDDVPFAMIYVYDFGDDWGHDVDVLAISDELVHRSELPRCLDGARSAPPENSGGVSGYERVLEILDDPDHKIHEEMRAWAGTFDPEHFDLDEVNRRMRGTDWQ